jgi:hypothetical protein
MRRRRPTLNIELFTRGVVVSLKIRLSNGSEQRGGILAKGNVLEIQLDEAQHRLYNKLFVSRLDLSSASYCLGVIMKKGWHFAPWEKRGSIYEQQTVFTTSFFVAYSRPFTDSRGWPKFPYELMSFDSSELDLHKSIIKRRNSVFAHSDSAFYSVKPWRTEGFATDILKAPVFCITAVEGETLRGMIGKLQLSINMKLKELVPE